MCVELIRAHKRDVDCFFNLDMTSETRKNTQIQACDFSVSSYVERIWKSKNKTAIFLKLS